MDSLHIDKTLDCSGMFCPMPVVKTNKAIKELENGQILRMIATDPGSIPDMEAWSAETGHELLESREDDETFIFVVRKAG